MAALRRLFPSLGSKAATFTARKPHNKALKAVAAGVCVTAAAGAAYYWRSVGGRGAPRSRVEPRLVHLALPSVSATDKVQWGICEGAGLWGQHSNSRLEFSFMLSSRSGANRQTTCVRLAQNLILRGNDSNDVSGAFRDLSVLKRKNHQNPAWSRDLMAAIAGAPADSLLFSCLLNWGKFDT